MYKEGQRKTMTQIGRDFGTSADTAERAAKDLVNMLKDFYRSRPDIMRFIGPGFMKDEDIEVPNYQEFMKENPSEQKDLYEHLEGQFKGRRAPSELTMTALQLFSKGKTKAEVSEEIKDSNPQVIQNIKSRYFDDEYKAWFEDRVKNIRKACVLC
jgi:hypothetical protein